MKPILPDEEYPLYTSPSNFEGFGEVSPPSASPTGLGALPQKEQEERRQDADLYTNQKRWREGYTLGNVAKNYFQPKKEFSTFELGAGERQGLIKVIDNQVFRYKKNGGLETVPIASINDRGGVKPIIYVGDMFSMDNKSFTKIAGEETGKELKDKGFWGGIISRLAGGKGVGGIIEKGVSSMLMGLPGMPFSSRILPEGSLNLPPSIINAITGNKYDIRSFMERNKYTEPEYKRDAKGNLQVEQSSYESGKEWGETGKGMLSAIGGMVGAGGLGAGPYLAGLIGTGVEALPRYGTEVLQERESPESALKKIVPELASGMIGVGAGSKILRKGFGKAFSELTKTGKVLPFLGRSAATLGTDVGLQTALGTGTVMSHIYVDKERYGGDTKIDLYGSILEISLKQMLMAAAFELAFNAKGLGIPAYRSIRNIYNTKKVFNYVNKSIAEGYSNDQIMKGLNETGLIETLPKVEDGVIVLGKGENVPKDVQMAEDLIETARYLREIQDKRGVLPEQYTILNTKELNVGGETQTGVYDALVSINKKGEVIGYKGSGRIKTVEQKTAEIKTKPETGDTPVEKVVNDKGEIGIHTETLLPIARTIAKKAFLAKTKTNEGYKLKKYLGEKYENVFIEPEKFAGEDYNVARDVATMDLLKLHEKALGPVDGLNPKEITDNLNLLIEADGHVSPHYYKQYGMKYQKIMSETGWEAKNSKVDNDHIRLIAENERALLYENIKDDLIKNKITDRGNVDRYIADKLDIKVKKQVDAKDKFIDDFKDMAQNEIIAKIKEGGLEVSEGVLKRIVGEAEVPRVKEEMAAARAKEILDHYAEAAEAVKEKPTAKKGEPVKEPEKPVKEPTEWEKTLAEARKTNPEEWAKLNKDFDNRLISYDDYTKQMKGLLNKKKTEKTKVMVERIKKEEALVEKPAEKELPFIKEAEAKMKAKMRKKAEGRGLKAEGKKKVVETEAERIEKSRLSKEKFIKEYPTFEDYWKTREGKIEEDSFGQKVKADKEQTKRFYNAMVEQAKIGKKVEGVKAEGKPKPKPKVELKEKIVVATKKAAIKKDLNESMDRMEKLMFGEEIKPKAIKGEEVKPKEVIKKKMEKVAKPIKIKKEIEKEVEDIFEGFNKDNAEEAYDKYDASVKKIEQRDWAEEIINEEFHSKKKKEETYVMADVEAEYHKDILYNLKKKSTKIENVDKYINKLLKEGSPEDEIPPTIKLVSVDKDGYTFRYAEGYNENNSKPIADYLFEDFGTSENNIKEYSHEKAKILVSKEVSESIKKDIIEAKEYSRYKGVKTKVLNPLWDEYGTEMLNKFLDKVKGLTDIKKISDIAQDLTGGKWKIKTEQQKADALKYARNITARTLIGYGLYEALKGDDEDKNKKLAAILIFAGVPKGKAMIIWRNKVIGSLPPYKAFNPLVRILAPEYLPTIEHSRLWQHKRTAMLHKGATPEMLATEKQKMSKIRKQKIIDQKFTSVPGATHATREQVNSAKYISKVSNAFNEGKQIANLGQTKATEAMQKLYTGLDDFRKLSVLLEVNGDIYNACQVVKFKRTDPNNSDIVSGYDVMDAVREITSPDNIQRLIKLYGKKYIGSEFKKSTAAELNNRYNEMREITDLANEVDICGEMAANMDGIDSPQMARAEIQRLKNEVADAKVRESDMIESFQELIKEAREYKAKRNEIKGTRGGYTEKEKARIEKETKAAQGKKARGEKLTKKEENRIEAAKTEYENKMTEYEKEKIADYIDGSRAMKSMVSKEILNKEKKIRDLTKYLFWLADSKRIHYMDERSYGRQNNPYALSIEEMRKTEDGNYVKAGRIDSKVKYFKNFRNLVKLAKARQEWDDTYRPKAIGGDLYEIKMLNDATGKVEDVTVQIKGDIDTRDQKKYLNTKLANIKQHIRLLQGNMAVLPIEVENVRAKVRKVAKNYIKEIDSHPDDLLSDELIRARDISEELLSATEVDIGAAEQIRAMQRILELSEQTYSPKSRYRRNVAGWRPETTKEWKEYYEGTMEVQFSRGRNGLVTGKAVAEIDRQIQENFDWGIKNSYTDYLIGLRETLAINQAKSEQTLKLGDAEISLSKIVNKINSYFAGGVLFASGHATWTNVAAGLVANIGEFTEKGGLKYLFQPSGPKEAFSAVLQDLRRKTKITTTDVSRLRDVLNDVAKSNIAIYKKQPLLSEIMNEGIERGIATDISISHLEGWQTKHMGLTKSKRDLVFFAQKAGEIFNRVQTMAAYAKKYLTDNPLEEALKRGISKEQWKKKCFLDMHRIVNKTQGVFDIPMRSSIEQWTFKTFPFAKDLLTLMSPQINQLSLWGSKVTRVVHPNTPAYEKRRALAGVMAMTQAAALFGGAIALSFVNAAVSILNNIESFEELDDKQSDLMSMTRIEGWKKEFREWVKSQGASEEDAMNYVLATEQGVLSAITGQYLAWFDSPFEMFTPFLISKLIQSYKDAGTIKEKGFAGLVTTMEHMFTTPGRILKGGIQLKEGRYLDKNLDIIPEDKKKFGPLQFFEYVLLGTTARTHFEKEGEWKHYNPLRSDKQKDEFIQKMMGVTGINYVSGYESKDKAFGEIMGDEKKKKRVYNKLVRANLDMVYEYRGDRIQNAIEKSENRLKLFKSNYNDTIQAVATAKKTGFSKIMDALSKDIQNYYTASVVIKYVHNRLGLKEADFTLENRYIDAWDDFKNKQIKDMSFGEQGFYYAIEKLKERIKEIKKKRKSQGGG